MAEGWTVGTVADVVDPRPGSISIGPFGSSLKAELYSESGVPVLRGQNLNDGRALDESDLVFVPEEVAARLPRSMAHDGDLVFPHRGAIGRVGLVSGSSYLLSSSMMKLTVDTQEHDPRFFFYYFKGPGRRELLMRASTVGTPGIGQPLTSLRGIPVEYPELPEQRAIAEVLGALDDKIAANDCVIHNADSLASATYSSLLSDRFETSLTALAEFINGKAFTKGASGTGRVVIRIAELNSGVGSSTVYSDAEVDDRYLARPGDILFAWSGSLTLHRWFRPEGIVNQHIFKVIPKAAAPKWLIWCAIADRLEYFKGVAADKATTMGHIQRRHLDETVVVPAPETVASHDGFMTALWDRAIAAEQESLNLATMRDALLPALMSGALRVKDAERLAEDLT